MWLNPNRPQTLFSVPLGGKVDLDVEPGVSENGEWTCTAGG